MFILMPPQAMRGGGYHVYTMSRCPMATSAFLSLLTNTERISMKFAGGSHYHQRTNWLHFGRNFTRDKEAGYDRTFVSTSNRCCHVASMKASYDGPRSLRIFIHHTMVNIVSIGNQ